MVGIDTAIIIIYDIAMKITDISSSLKQARLRRGLSLSQLARRAGTSAPTISRYENGWDRFELYTLQKLATALGYSLRIKLMPVNETSAPGNTTELCQQLKRLFWDRALKSSDLSEYAGWVVKRVLEYGSLDDIKALSNAMGRDRFLEEVSSLRFDSKRTRVFWQHMLEKEGVKCTPKFFQKAVPNSWQN